MVFTENSSYIEIPYVGPERAAEVTGSREKLLNTVLGGTDASKVGEKIHCRAETQMESAVWYLERGGSCSWSFAKTPATSV